MNKLSIHKIRGASLVQVIISFALLSATFLGLINLIKQQAETSESSSREFEMVYLTDEIKSLLSDQSICTATLKGKNPNSDELQSIKRPLESGDILELFTISSLDQTLYGQNNLRIKSYKLTDEAHELQARAGTAELLITYEDAINRELQTKRRIKLYINLDKNFRITSCKSLPGLLAQNSYPQRAQSLWHQSKTQNSLFTDIKPVVIGELEKESEVDDSIALIHSHGIQFHQYPKGQNTVCKSENLGSLRLDQATGQLKQCKKNGKWALLEPINLKNLATNEFQVSSAKRGRKGLGKQLICTITKASTSGGQCQLLKSLSGNWVLSAIGSETSCESRCFSKR